MVKIMILDRSFLSDHKSFFSGFCRHDLNFVFVAKLGHHVYYDPFAFSGPHRFILYLFLLFLALGFSLFASLCSDLFDLELDVLDLRLLRSNHDLLLLDLGFHIVFKGCHLCLELLKCLKINVCCCNFFDHSFKNLKININN